MSVTEYGLGRIPSPPDARDYTVGFLKAAVLRGKAIPMTWECSAPPLNQGGTQHCVGFCGENFRATSQADGAGAQDATDQGGHILYYKVKEVEGRTTPDVIEEGATIRGLMKVLRNEGVIDYYGFGSFSESQDWVQNYGSVCWGTKWYESMFHPDGQGIIVPTGVVSGGHAWLQLGDKQKPADNLGLTSWGEWGRNKDSRFWLDDASLYKLKVEFGEAAMAVKLLAPVYHWSDLPAMSPDDLLSQDAVWKKSLMQGYPIDKDGHRLFKPGDDITRHQLGTIMVRMGKMLNNEWKQHSDYTTAITRGWAKEHIPELPFRDGEMDRILNRFELLVLAGRMLRGVE